MLGNVTAIAGLHVPEAWFRFRAHSSSGFGLMVLQVLGSWSRGRGGACNLARNAVWAALERVLEDGFLALLPRLVFSRAGGLVERGGAEHVLAQHCVLVPVSSVAGSALARTKCRKR